jgi:diguanylate cyclase (GGDEF)-like protein
MPGLNAADELVMFGGGIGVSESTVAAPRAALGAPAARRRTATLALLLVTVSAIGLVQFRLVSPTTSDPILTWWMIALVAVVAELMAFDVEFRREVYTFTFSEVALVLGLLLADPLHLLAGRLLGEAVYLVVRQRQRPEKLLLNLAAFLCETMVLLGVHRLLGGSTAIARPSTWLMVLVAIAAADLAGFVIVYTVVRWHGAPITLGSILSIGMLTIPVNTSFALVIGILLSERPWATLLLAGVGAFLVLAYRSYASLRQRFDSLSLLYEFTRLVSGAQRPDAILEAMLTQAKDLLRAERAELWLHDDNDTLWRIRVSDDGHTGGLLGANDSLLIRPWFEAHPEACAIEVVTATGMAAQLISVLEAKNCIVAPITESGAIVGLVAVLDRLGDQPRFEDSERTMFATLAHHASVALENGRLIDRLHHEASEREHEATHDSLTGLPNRVLFAQRLRNALVEVDDEPVHAAVGLMDLDGFKEINDTLGHQVGDVVLAEVGRRLRMVVDPGVHVARLGGDEFALLLVGASDRIFVEAAGRRIREEVARPLLIDGMRINVTASLGFALAPEDASDGSTLLQRADIAMYRAKAGLGNGVAFYESTSDENSPRRLQLVSGLRSAISDGQLFLVYQPKADLVSGEVLGFEALVRWRHPELGLLMPDEFIPLAERAGSITELTQFVLRTAFAQAGVWRNLGRDWSVAVNISTRNLLDDDFVASVADLLITTSCNPDLVTFEITETSVMTDTKRTIDVMRGLAQIGIRLSVDDFGTGYSSLMYLQQLPVEEIKIDKLFVSKMETDPNAEAIVRSVIDLARNLGLRVVGEGIEDRYLWERLGQLGCDIGQGYYLARPMPVNDIAPWVAAWEAANSPADLRLVAAIAAPSSVA